MTLTWIALGLALGRLLLGLALRFNAHHTPALDGEPIPSDWAAGAAPTVLLVVPARNEEANLPACVAALRASTYPALRIRVVDDGSTDRTGAIARAAAAADPRIEVIEGGPLPGGWLGKNHALWVGARDATEKFLLFLDADMQLAPDGIARAVAAAERTGADLLTMVPRIEIPTFWEQAVQGLIVEQIYTWLPAREINDPRKRPAAGIGPFLLFRRSAYERVGGHAAVRSQVVEDLMLARAVKDAGQRLIYARGIGLASLRMYDSLGAIVRGWSKNFHVALGRAYALAPLAAAALLFFYWAPWGVATLAVLRRDLPALFLIALAPLLEVGNRIILLRHYGIRRGWRGSDTVGAAVLAWIMVRSAWRAALGRTIEWKGRAVR